MASGGISVEIEREARPVMNVLRVAILILLGWSGWAAFAGEPGTEADAGTVSAVETLESISGTQPGLQWIDEQGQAKDLPFRYSGEWLLRLVQEPGFKTQIKRPVFVLSLTPAAGEKFETVQLEIQDSAAHVEFNSESASLTLEKAQTSVQIRMAKKEGGPEELSTYSGSLIIRWGAEEPSRMTLDRCAELGWRWRTPAQKGKVPDSFVPLFVAVADCSFDEAGNFRATVLWPRGISLQAISALRGEGTTPPSDSPVTESKTPPPQATAVLLASDAAAQVRFRERLTLELKERVSGNESRSFLGLAEFVRDDSGPRFFGSAGGGFSVLSYSELPLDVEKTFFAVTVKGGLNYWIMPRHLDAAVSGYFSATPLTLAQSSSSVSQPSAQFFGLNARAGYQLTHDQHRLGPWNVKFSMGYYGWGMLAPPLSYGVNIASGPQVFISAGNVPGRSPWSVYIKLAPISDDPLSASLRSRELAVGGNIPAPYLSQWGPWTLALDLAQTEIHFSAAKNVIGLSVLSLSVGRSF